MSELPEITDPRTLAELIGVTDRRVRQLVREGVMPKVGRGQYPLARCVQAYIGYWQRQAEEAATNGGPPDYKKARARKIQADAELKELQLDRERGDVVPADSVEAVIRDALEPVDVGLRTAHSRLGRDWAERLGIAEGEAVHLIRDLTEDLREHLLRVLDGEDEDLPEDLPWRSYLEEAGVETYSELRELEELTEIPGIGPARARDIMEAVG